MHESFSAERVPSPFEQKAPTFDRRELPTVSVEQVSARLGKELKAFAERVGPGGAPNWEMLYNLYTTGELLRDDPYDEEDPMRGLADRVVEREGKMNLEKVKVLLEAEFAEAMQQPFPKKMAAFRATLFGEPPRLEEFLTGENAKLAGRASEGLGSEGYYLPPYSQHGFPEPDHADFVMYRSPASYEKRQAFEQEPRVRFYLNPKLGALADVVETCLKEVKASGLPVEFKFISQSPYQSSEMGQNSGMMARQERVVFYVPESVANKTKELIDSIAAKHEEAFAGQEVGMMQSPLRDGVGMADDPSPKTIEATQKDPHMRKPKGVSFHMSRAAFLRVASIEASKALLEDHADLKEALRLKLEEKKGPTPPARQGVVMLTVAEQAWPHVLSGVTDAERSAALKVAIDTLAPQWGIDPEDLSRNKEG